jgi:hypothetical protein
MQDAAMKNLFLVLASVSLAAVVAGCGGGDDDDGSGDTDGGSTPEALPLIKPPVERATPEGFLSAAAIAPHLLDSADIKGRFFTEGPTSIFRILDEIDGRVTGINGRNADGTHACNSQEPVEYTITPWGQSVTMYARCFETFGDGGADGFIQWAQADGVTWLYSQVGSGQLAFITTEADETDEYQVQAWLTVGDSTAEEWDGGSYGVIQLQADSAAVALELAVAGMGFGYCGAQLRSDGTIVYAEGSLDMSATCLAIDTLCVAADDVTTPATCEEPLTTWEIDSLGREAAPSSGIASEPAKPETWGASTYPASGPNVTLDGSDTDDMHFGPTEPTAGVTAL